MAQHRDHGVPVFSPAARLFHWLTVLLVAIQVTIGLYMTYRAYEMTYVDAEGTLKTGLFDGVTNQLYDSHKLLGITILVVVLLRLLYRFANGAPPYDASAPQGLVRLGQFNHWLMYLLLVAVPIGGYIGISYFGALEPFGIRLPAATVKDEKFAETVFWWHGTAALTLLGLITLHILGAIYHRGVRKDHVVDRMLPRRTVV